jgi:CheY-like chemotaxis protein
MGGDARLNLLLTPPPLGGAGSPPPQAADSQPWYKTLTHLLVPLGVRTFEAQSGPEAVALIEKHPIHLAVVDTRLPAISGMNVLQLVQRLRDQRPAPQQPSAPGFQFHMQVEERTEQAGGQTQRRIEVRFESQPGPRPGGPVVILIAPPPQQQDRALLQEALKFNAFSVLSEPVDVNLALDVMARALKRFHQNQWPA